MGAPMGRGRRMLLCTLHSSCQTGEVARCHPVGVSLTYSSLCCTSCMWILSKRPQWRDVGASVFTLCECVVCLSTCERTGAECVCVCVCVCVWWGEGSEKETGNGRKNGPQAKQAARQPITRLKAAAIPYKAGTHTSRHWWGTRDAETSGGHQRAPSAPAWRHAGYVYRAVIFKRVPSRLIRVQVSTTAKTLQQLMFMPSTRKDIISEYESITLVVWKKHCRLLSLCTSGEMYIQLYCCDSFFQLNCILVESGSVWWFSYKTVFNHLSILLPNNFRQETNQIIYLM